MEDKVTIDSILETMKGWVESRTPIQPTLWLDAAQKLIALLSDLDDVLIEAKMKYERLDRRRSQIIEFIRIAKKKADLKQYE